MSKPVKKIEGTAHIRAKKSDFAKTVLMPGDPLRAKWIAENFLEDAKQINDVRNMFGYTGTYKGKKVTVMGSGMGVASIGIYSYELFAFFGVENIIRIGTCGAYDAKVPVGKVMIAKNAYSESTYAQLLKVKATKKPGGFQLPASKELTAKAVAIAKDLKIANTLTTIHSSDAFYNANTPAHYAKLGYETVEMEAYGLYTNAKKLGKNALTICTVSDNIVTHEQMSAEQRQTSLKDMVTIALEMAVRK